MDEANNIDAHTIAAFIADDLWRKHAIFHDDDGFFHHCEPDGVEDNVIQLRVDGERFTVTVTKDKED